MPIQTLTFPGTITERGFWLYVCRIESPAGELLYVGRTGDSSSSRATSPFTRIGLHLGNNRRQARIRHYLETRNPPIEPSDCREFQIVAYGPMNPEVQGWNAHKVERDRVAAMERALADALGVPGGYTVLNKVNCRIVPDINLWQEVREEFAQSFPRIGPGPQAPPGA